MKDCSALDRALDELAASGTVEVREDGEWLADFSDLRWQLRGNRANPQIHLWSEGRSLTRAVVAIKEQSAGRLVLDVRRFGRDKPGRLEFLRVDTAHSPARVTREQFRARFARILAACFPDAAIGPLTAAPDLKRSFSGVHLRGVMYESSLAWALLAASPSESSAIVEASLAFGILWLDSVRARGERRPVQGLRLFVPEGTGRRMRERVLALSSSACTEIFEFSEREEQVRKMDPADAGNLESWLVPKSEIDSVIAAARDAAARIRALAARSPYANGEIAQRVLPGGRETAFTFRGLEFARWSLDGISFGLDDPRKRLSALNETALAGLLADLDLHRNSLASETKHALYRRAPERWLETLILEDPTRLDAFLDVRFFYSQIPALSAGDRGVLDLLGVTRKGRLVVIELKASTDLQMPIQAVDYWLRVARHHQEGTFQRYGYFSGIELDPQPPLVWLVAPSLQFHSTCEVLLKYLSQEIKVSRIGLNENWRRGVNVVFRR